jgi:hypothetical protein
MQGGSTGHCGWLGSKGGIHPPSSGPQWHPWYDTQHNTWQHLHINNNQNIQVRPRITVKAQWITMDGCQCKEAALGSVAGLAPPPSSGP